MDHARPTLAVTRRSLLGFGVAGAGALILAACSPGTPTPSPTKSGPASGTLDVSFWGTQDQIDATLAAFTAFQGQNSRITVNSQYSAYEGYFDKLSTRVAGGDAPDIFQIDLPFMSDYASRGVVLELDDYVEQLGLNTLPGSVGPLSKADGHYYFAMVGGITQPGMAYNEDLLKDLGLDAPDSDWTFDDFEKQVTEVADASNGKVFGTNDFGAAVVAVESFMRGRGKALYSDDGGLGFGEKDLKAWLQFWQDLRDTKAAPPMSYTSAQIGFKDYPIVKGESVFSQVPTARGVAALQALTTSKITMTTFPSVEKDGVLGTTIVPVAIWAVSAKSASVPAAVELLSYLTGSPEASAALGIQGGVPFDEAARDALYPQLKPAGQAIVDIYSEVSDGELAPVQVQPAGAGQILSAANSAIVTANQSVGFGQATVSQAVSEFFATAERILGQ